jgi:uncharacterized protein with HEPN domain
MEKSAIPYLADITLAIKHIHEALNNVTLEAFEGDWQKRWLVERGIEIISEASRRLPQELKDRRPDIPWQKVAGIGNVLRHNYEDIAPSLLWLVVKEHLVPLEKICAEEIRRESKER